MKRGTSIEKETLPSRSKLLMEPYLVLRLACILSAEQTAMLGMHS